MKIVLSSIRPSISKSAIPGGVATITHNASIVPFDLIFGKTQNASGINIVEKNIYCGDFLSFDYVSREIPNISDAISLPKNKKTIYNPLIIFAGFDPATKLIYGVELRKFRLSGLDAEARKIFRIIKEYYYTTKFTEDGKQILEKKPFSLISVNPQFVFKYEYLSKGIFSSLFPILKQFYRSYNILSIKNCVTFSIEKIELFYNQTVKALPGIIE